jgi:hypothetical protein
LTAGWVPSRQEQQEAMLRLRKPLQVVTQKKSLIRCEAHTATSVNAPLKASAYHSNMSHTLQVPNAMHVAFAHTTNTWPVWPVMPACRARQTSVRASCRYTSEGKRYWRWRDVVARVLHICRGASADDYSLLLQTEHWLEACDHKHRYGSNLKPYFKAWLEADTQQSFFKWLDEGDGVALDIPERYA